MKDFLKNNFVIILALSLPVLFIIGVVVVVNFPRSLPTDYDFVYAVCDGGRNYIIKSSCNTFLQKKYNLKDNRLQINDDPITETNYDGEVINLDEVYESHIIFHDVKRNESREISLDEAGDLMLQDSIISPDGAIINSNYYKGDIFPFGRSSIYEARLEKDNRGVRLNLVGLDDRNLDQDFKFIGWVLPE